MTLTIYILLIFINLLWGIKYIFYPFNKNPGRKSGFITGLSIIGCYILMSGYRNLSGLSNDLSNNAYEFQRIIGGNASGYEFGYIALSRLGANFTQDYYVWRQLIIIIFLIILFVAIYRLSENPHFIYALFCAYLIILSAEQLRNFIALVVFMVGLLVFVETDYKRKKIFYVVMTILASTIHSIFIIYLILIFADKTFNERATKRIALLVTVFCVMIFANGNNIPGMRVILSIVAGDRAAIYLSQKTRLGFLYPMLMHISSVIISYMIMKKCESRSYKNELIFKINTLMMVCFPLYMLQTSFYRIARNLLLITYLAEGESILSKDIVLKNKLVIILLSLLSVVLWFYIDLYITTPSEALLKPFFENNCYF